MYHLIVNIKSGKGRGKRALKKISNYCYKNNIAYTSHITAARGHAIDIAKMLSSTGETTTIVAIGGDGTFSEVLNGIADFDKTHIGFVPSGRGNDYARAANLSLNPVAAFTAILNGKVEETDYIEVGDKRCLNVVGSGLDVEVLERVMGKSGRLTYIKSLLHCVLNFKPYSFTVSIDGGEKVFHECLMVGVCNGTSIGAGIKLSPESDINDGKINVMVIEPPKDEKVLKALFTFKRGKHMKKPYTKHFVCNSVEITPAGDRDYSIQIDGEIFSDVEFNAKVVKGGLKTFR